MTTYTNLFSTLYATVLTCVYRLNLLHTMIHLMDDILELIHVIVIILRIPECYNWGEMI